MTGLIGISLSSEIARLSRRLEILRQAIRLPGLGLESIGRAFTAWCDDYEQRDALMQAQRRGERLLVLKGKSS